MSELREKRDQLYILKGGVCDFCHSPLGSDFQRHHSQHDTIGNNNKFPLYTQSFIGFKAMHSICHHDNPSFGSIPDDHAELWEQLLQTFEKLIKCKAVIPLFLIVEEFKWMIKKSRGRENVK